MMKRISAGIFCHFDVTESEHIIETGAWIEHKRQEEKELVQDSAFAALMCLIPLTH
jgi:hypothetical protein